MEKKKSYQLLIIGLILLAISIIAALYTYHTSYQLSTETAAQISEIKAQIRLYTHTDVGIVGT